MNRTLKKFFTAMSCSVIAMLSSITGTQAQSVYKPMTGPGVQVGTVGSSGGLCVTQFCLGSGYQDLQNVIDNDITTGAFNTSLATVLGSNGLSVKNYNTVYPAGYVAGYLFSSNNLIDISLFGGITVSTYREGQLQESKTIANLGSATIDPAGMPNHTMAADDYVRTNVNTPVTGYFQCIYRYYPGPRCDTEMDYRYRN
jgi:hypothetical protein